MKKCSTCREEKSETEFNRNKSNSSGLQNQCKVCQRESVKLWYSRNRAAKARSTSLAKTRRRNITRQRILEYYATHPCVDCGESDPVVLEFDHVRGEKRNNISNMAYGVVRPWSVIEAEIAKCDVRCANCHRRKTARQFNWLAHSYRGKLESTL